MNNIISILILSMFFINKVQSQTKERINNFLRGKDSIVILKTFQDFNNLLNKMDKDQRGYFIKAGCCIGGESWGKPSKYRITYIAHLEDSVGMVYKLTTKDKSNNNIF
jgi:hypothetical protein